MKAAIIICLSCLFVSIVLTLLLAPIAAAASPTKVRMDLHSDNSPELVANDGSAFGYYVEAGNIVSSVVVHHPGGGFCWENGTGTNQDCAIRKAALSSFSALKPTIARDVGVLSHNCDTNPILCNAHFAQMSYQSSDLCTGAGYDAALDFHFTGKARMLAMLQLLIDDHGLDNGETVYLTGSSAGAYCLIYNAQDLYDLYFAPGQPLDQSEFWILAGDGWANDTPSFTGDPITVFFANAAGVWGSTQTDYMFDSIYAGLDQEIKDKMLIAVRNVDNAFARNLQFFQSSTPPTQAELDWINQTGESVHAAAQTIQWLMMPTVYKKQPFIKFSHGNMVRNAYGKTWAGLGVSTQDCFVQLITTGIGCHEVEDWEVAE